MPILWLGDKVLSATEQKAQRGLRKAATWGVRQIKRSLNVQGARLGRFKTSKTGRKVYKRGSKRRYVPSKAGERPHRQLGTLKKSIDYIETPLSMRIGTALDYGLYLEGGTKNMDKRPFLRPFIDSRANQKKIEELVARG